jgi:hypothetical protein
MDVKLEVVVIAVSDVDRAKWHSAQCIFIRRLRKFSPLPCPDSNPLRRGQESGPTLPTGTDIFT